jgi:hypothetical protein
MATACFYYSIDRHTIILYQKLPSIYINTSAIHDNNRSMVWRVRSYLFVVMSWSLLFSCVPVMSLLHIPMPAHYSHGPIFNFVVIDTFVLVTFFAIPRKKKKKKVEIEQCFKEGAIMTIGHNIDRYGCKHVKAFFFLEGLTKHHLKIKWMNR